MSVRVCVGVCVFVNINRVEVYVAQKCQLGMDQGNATDPSDLFVHSNNIGILIKILEYEAILSRCKHY